MGNRRKSWRRALMEGTQTLTGFCGFMIIIVFIFNTTNHIDAYEYYYLIGSVFIIGAMITYRYTLEQAKQFVKAISAKLKKNNNK